MMTAAQREMIANDYAERAFFVSGVEPGVILSDFEDKAAKVASGALSYEEAQQAIRETCASRATVPRRRVREAFGICPPGSASRS